jgi:hypothetical protein
MTPHFNDMPICQRGQLAGCSIIDSPVPFLCGGVCNDAAGIGRACVILFAFEHIHSGAGNA